MHPVLAHDGVDVVGRVVAHVHALQADGQEGAVALVSAEVVDQCSSESKSASRMGRSAGGIGSEASSSAENHSIWS